MDTSIRKPASGTVFFILFTAFLNLAGVGILNPIVPFIVGKYVARADGAFVVSLLFTSYSLCQFLAVPTLGALSDRFGRRPVMLISLLGSAAGYLIFGLGGALWVLFLGRIIDGLTGGNIATIYAYGADITEPKDRTHFFGLLGAAAGMGFVMGPALAALLYKLTNTFQPPLIAALWRGTSGNCRAAGDWYRLYHHRRRHGNQLCAAAIRRGDLHGDRQRPDHAFSSRAAIAGSDDARAGARAGRQSISTGAGACHRTAVGRLDLWQHRPGCALHHGGGNPRCCRADRYCSGAD